MVILFVLRPFSCIFNKKASFLRAFFFLRAREHFSLWASFFVGIFHCGHFSLWALFLVGIFACGHFSLWAFFPVGIFPCGHFSCGHIYGHRWPRLWRGWRCAGFTYYYGERVFWHLLPNNTLVIRIHAVSFEQIT